MTWGKKDSSPGSGKGQQPCGACHGKGGTWVTQDGASPGKNLVRWVACQACNGTGEQR
ncbi:hypothetical protein JCM3263A_21750 [Thermobifida fusca]|jgi:DnaJ-class molecular chaperone